mmetsp:Transcript_14782/g.47138  ORF Transcript_14782/g.47138 Transcript_14782/m.47138 type:complete len:202 (+) Transcript_14782:279-884(+)
MSRGRRDVGEAFAGMSLGDVLPAASARTRTGLLLKDPQDVAAAAMTCRAWRDALRADELWRELYLRHLHPSNKGPELAGLDAAAAREGGWGNLYRSLHARRHRALTARALSKELKGQRLRLRPPAKAALDATTNAGAVERAIANLGLSFSISVNACKPAALGPKEGAVHHPLGTSARLPPTLVEGLRAQHPFPIAILLFAP